MTVLTCSVEDCDGVRYYSKPWCLKHYTRWRKHGDVSVNKRVTHGYSRSPEYGAWQDVIARCCKPKSQSYAEYGGRGIGVCEQWQHSFPMFLRDVGLRPGSHYMIERVDNDKGYEPGNVCWATPKEQAQNRRTNVNLTIDGETKCLQEWSRVSGVPITTIRARLKRKPKDIKAAIFTVPHPKNQQLTYHGRTQSFLAWANDLDIPRHRIYSQLARGVSVEAIFDLALKMQDERKEHSMITATDAQQLYAEPPFTQEQVEAQIRNAAKSRTWTSFDMKRLTVELIAQLTASGFKIDAGTDDYIVNWKAEAA